MAYSIASFYGLQLLVVVCVGPLVGNAVAPAQKSGRFRSPYYPY
jgi:hypothetical protein